MSQKEEIEKEVITKETFEQFVKKEVVDRKNAKNNLDRIIVLIAFIYDFNFMESYRIVKETNYIDKVIDLFKFKEQDTIDKMELVRKIANEYINNKLKEE